MFVLLCFCLLRYVLGSFLVCLFVCFMWVFLLIFISLFVCFFFVFVFVSLFVYFLCISFFVFVLFLVSFFFTFYFYYMYAYIIFAFKFCTDNCTLSYKCFVIWYLNWLILTLPEMTFWYLILLYFVSLMIHPIAYRGSWGWQLGSGKIEVISFSTMFLGGMKEHKSCKWVWYHEFIVPNYLYYNTNYKLWIQLSFNLKQILIVINDLCVKVYCYH